MTVFFKFILGGLSAHVSSFLFFWVSSVWGALIVSPCFFLASENFDHEDSRVARFFGWARNVNIFSSSATTRPAFATPHLPVYVSQDFSSCTTLDCQYR